MLSLRLPVILYIPTKIKLPIGCPFKSVYVSNLYWSSSLILSSALDILTITFLISPIAGIKNSSLSLPVEDPLSDTVIIAVISTGKFFKPRSKKLMPVPPPKTTTFLFIIITYNYYNLKQTKKE